jgi:hypothetical protein
MLFMIVDLPFARHQKFGQAGKLNKSNAMIIAADESPTKSALLHDKIDCYCVK